MNILRGNSMDKILIKQDINFLDKPLWFANLRSNDKSFVWDDIEGFEYRSGFRAPDKVDAIILYYLLYRCQLLDYKNEIILSRYEILKGCGLLKKNQSYYYKRIETSLECWKNVTLKFDGIFYDKKEYKMLLFGILDEAKIREEDKMVEIHFNKSWLCKIKESNFFKNLNFEYMKRLKRPVSLRLYELLVKNFKGRNECYYKLTNLGVRLTLSGRINKKGEEVIYASDVLTKIVPAINEINKLAMTPQISEITGIPKNEIFVIKYRIRGKGQDRVIHFYKEAIPKKQTHQKAKTELAKKRTEESSTEQPIKIHTEVNNKHAEALQWIDTIPYFNKKRKQEIAELPPSDIEKVYIGIRKEYERLTNEGKKPKVGWVYKAFMEGWEFSGILEAEEKEKIKANLQKKIENNKENVKKFIAENGGSQNVLYGNDKIEVMEDYGLYIVEQNALETWTDVNISLLKKVES